MSLTPDQLQAAREFVDATIEKLRSERGVHLETAIAATARMAGTFLFRSFGFELNEAQPGQPVLSEQANENGPRLIDILGEALSEAGISLDLSGLDAAPSDEHDPQLNFLESQRLLEPAFNDIRTKFNLSLSDGADAAAEATASLIVQGAHVLDPSVAFNIAVYGFIEGSKTVPVPL